MSVPPNLLPPQQASGMSPQEVEQMVKRFLAQGNTESQVATLMGENYQYREKNRQLTEQVTQLSAKVPAEGSLVLAGDDLKAYNEFLALKLKPAEVATLQGEMTKLKGEVEGAKRDKAVDTAAAAEGYDPVVLRTLIGDKDLVTKPVDEDVDGEKKKVDRAFILTKGANDVVTEERLSKYVEDNHPKFLPSLRVADGENTGTGSSSGTQFPRQRASTGAKGTKVDASQAYLQKKYRSQPAQGAANK